MNTKYITVDPLRPDPGILEAAGAVLRRGGLAAFPTETVYGLGADALNGSAVAKIFTAKGRPADNPLIVHVADKEAIGGLVRKLTGAAEALFNAFWPGPLTVILPAGGAVPAQVTAGLDTVAVRMPAHPIALGLIRAAGVPVAAPSANKSGRPSPTTAKHVLDDLDGRIDLILDGGPAGIGVESTVVDLTAAVPLVLRPGGVTPEDLRRVLGDVAVDPAVRSGLKGESRPRSPGMKYTHYAPRAPLYLIEGETEAAAVKIMELARAHQACGRRVGILSYNGGRDYSAAGEVVPAGRRDRPDTVAAALYAALRRFDEIGVDVILAESLPEKGVGLAVMNRLRRAAAGGIIRV